MYTIAWPFLQRSFPVSILIRVTFGPLFRPQWWLSFFAPRVRGNQPSGVERHTGRTGEEPSSRHHLTGAPALAWERVLLGTDRPAENWQQITSQDLALKPQ